jgi:hypothetical protein
VAALIREDTGIEPELVEGARGEFTAWVGEARVAQKTAHGFPSDDEIRAAVRAALPGG